MTQAYSTRRLQYCLIWLSALIALWAFTTQSAFSPQLQAQEIEQDLTPSDVMPRAPTEAPGVEQMVGDSLDGKKADKIVMHEKGLNLLDLLSRGGWFMIPLGLLSILVVALSIERFLALREEKVLPQPFVRELGALSRNDEGFDPRFAYRACQVHPSAAARVVRTMLLKAGRPQSEVEHAVSEASQREASKLQSTVSWLTLAAAVAPLIGLMGTVWGMIQAFYDTTQLIPGQNKAEVLAQGIYVALVTTLCGLVIAIPSAVLAHYFDSRIVSWFHRIEELTASLTPMMEQYEGKLRTSEDGTPDLDSPVSARTSPSNGNSSSGTGEQSAVPGTYPR